MSNDPQRKVYTDHAAVIETLVTARDADPRVSPFGVLVQDPWEDGDQQFFWYPSRAEMEYALLDAHAFVDPGGFEEDQEEWREAQFDLDNALQQIRELRPHDAEELDDLVNDFFCIVWIGHFEDLFEENDPIARELREELRWDDDNDDDDSPVKPEELDDFVALLRAFGAADE